MKRCSRKFQVLKLSKVQFWVELTRFKSEILLLNLRSCRWSEKKKKKNVKTITMEWDRETNTRSYEEAINPVLTGNWELEYHQNACGRFRKIFTYSMCSSWESAWWGGKTKKENIWMIFRGQSQSNDEKIKSLMDKFCDTVSQCMMNGRDIKAILSFLFS